MESLHAITSRYNTTYSLCFLNVLSKCSPADKPTAVGRRFQLGLARILIPLPNRSEQTDCPEFLPSEDGHPVPPAEAHAGRPRYPLSQFLAG